MMPTGIAKAAIKWVLPVCVLLATLAGSLALFRVAHSPSVFFTTTSRGGAYTVDLTGQKDRPMWPFVTHTVQFNILKHGRSFLSDKYLHSGDWMDPSYEISFPNHAWIRDDVLHFYREQNLKDGVPESLVIINRTEHTINYLNVNSIDTFLLFDVQPGSKTELTVSPPRWDGRWISVEGEYAGGKTIKRSGESFTIPKGQKGPFSYYIYITGDGPIIESKQLEKYRGTD